MANTSTKIKSDVWKHFGVILENKNNVVEGFTACKSCLKVFVYDSRKCGTSSLRKHAENCVSSVNPRPSTENFFQKKIELGVPHKEDKDAITRLCVNFACNDIRPFEAVHCEGFFAVAQGLIDVGARSGRVDAK